MSESMVVSAGNGLAAQGKMTQRQEFGASELAVSGETASSAAAAQARAAIESRYVMALRRPRDLDEVRVRLLKECSRPGFAEAAIYSKPVGGNPLEGPSIRFAEAAMRCMTNMLPETSTIYDDAQKRIIRVSVTDLEANVTYTKDVVLAKTVERSKLRNGQSALSVRTNSAGKNTYLVEATEDDLLNKENALASKAMRTCALRHLPGDILEEAIEKCRETQKNKAAKDPDGERKRIVDAFAALAVTPGQLKEYLGHELAMTTPAELVDLRSVYSALRDGEANWSDVLETKGKSSAPTAPPPAPAKQQATKPATEAAKDLVEKAVAAEADPTVTLTGEEMKAAAAKKLADLENQILEAMDKATTQPEMLKVLRLIHQHPDAQKQTELKVMYSGKVKSMTEAK